MKQAQCPSDFSPSVYQDLTKCVDESCATGLITSHEDLKNHVACACTKCGKHIQFWPVFEAACKASGVAEPSKTAGVSNCQPGDGDDGKDVDPKKCNDDICKDHEYGGCEIGDWGGGKSFRHTCRNGVNFVTHYQKLGCAGTVVEESQHGDQCFEDNGRYGRKWCRDDGMPMLTWCEPPEPPFKCGGKDDIVGLKDDSKGVVNECSSDQCSPDAYTDKGAPENWYLSRCCATCKYSPGDHNDKGEGDDHCYGTCMKQAQCPSDFSPSVYQDLTKCVDESCATGLITSHKDLKNHVACACTKC